jgi:hypothetical protein
MPVTDGMNKGKHHFKLTTPSGSTMSGMADSEFEFRQKVAHRMTRQGKISYGAAWAVVSPSHGKVKVEKIA